MNQKVLYALVGIAIIAMASVGFGASLTTTPTIQRIGGTDSTTVSAARGNITNIGWTEEVTSAGIVEVDAIQFSVGNEDDSNAHQFYVCVVIEGPAGTYTPSAGSAPLCLTTASIAKDAKAANQAINFTNNAVNVANIVDISVSIEELT